MRKQSSAYIEMLFENRNKEYGAYNLRVNYERRLFRSFGLALLIAGFFFLIPYVLTKILTAEHSVSSIDKLLVYDLTKKYVIEKTKPAGSVSSTKAKSVSANTTYKVVKKVDEKKVEEQKPADPVSTSENKGAGIAIASDSSSSSSSNIVPEDSTSTEIMSTSSVDVLPAFPGGEDAMLKFLSKNLHYTDEAKDNRIAGRVYATFVIDEKGEIESISIMRGLGYGMDEEVSRVIGIMPRWSPGKYHNQNVKTAFVLPVLFSLK